jgi:hypothetical protein
VDFMGNGGLSRVFNDASAFCILRPEVTYTLEQHISELTRAARIRCGRQASGGCRSSRSRRGKAAGLFEDRLGFSRIGCF